MVRARILAGMALAMVLVCVAAMITVEALWLLAILVPIALVALHDITQKRHAVLRNFPVIGHLRYLLESIRPEIQQYFVESNIDAYPIEREFRALVYQRAKGELDTRPFGTQRDVYRIGYEWASHSLAARSPSGPPPRVRVGGPACTQPYDASLLNISAMSYGALSTAALEALNWGAHHGGFAHNTGEGGIAKEHLGGGADLIWQIGTGYFGCRTPEGGFDAEAFRRNAERPTVKMIEIKLSQGAKPGHGGVLPGIKVTAEIAAVRGVEIGKTVLSPPTHSEFDSPRGLLEFVQRLRELSGGKPVGFKLCIGRRSDFFGICKAMLETGVMPDFITVDGGEGGTGAAPLEFSNSLGMPARDAWIFVHNALNAVDLRQHIRIIASGKIMTGFQMVRALAMGADLCASARGFMFSLGCIQSLRCNDNVCPTGVATQDPRLVYGLDVQLKKVRVARYHEGTVAAFREMLGAMGLDTPEQLAPHHIFRRLDDLHVRHLGELYDFATPGAALAEGGLPEAFRSEWHLAHADTWGLAAESGATGELIAAG